jgi:hypothetical protein
MKRTTAWSVIVLLSVTGAGCTKSTDRAEAGPAPSPPAGKPKDSKMANEITWKLTKQGDHLHVTYHFENHTPHVVYVNNGLVAQVSSDRWVKTDLNVDTEVVDAETILITVGTPAGDVPAAAAPQGFYVPVAKGASFDGSRDIPLPLTTTDAMGRSKPLGDKFKKVTFELYAFDGEPKWRELPTDKGAVKVPDAPPIRMLTGAAQPMP